MLNPLIDHRIGQALKIWLAVGVMTAIELMALIDRGALNLLIGPITATLGLSKGQVEQLFGFHLALIYGASALVIGHLVDRFNRQRVLITCAVAWAALTALSAFAGGYIEIMVVRLSVGMVAGAVVPVAYSIIQSRFELGRRARGFGLIQLGAALGSGACTLVVGNLVRVSAKNGMFTIAGDTRFYPWQIVMLIIGGVGILTALLMLWVEEPPRAAGDAKSRYSRADTSTDGTVRSMMLYVHRNRAIYRPMALTFAAIGMGMYAYLVWLPQAMHNAWGIGIPEISNALGGVHVTGGFFGFLGVGIIIDRYGSRRSILFAPISGGVAALAAAAGLAAVTQTSSVPVLWALYAASWVGLCWATVCASVALAAVTPNRIMGKLAACSTILVGLVGGAAGTALVGEVAGSLFIGQNALGDALSLIGGGALAIGGIAQLWMAGAMSRAASLAVSPTQQPGSGVLLATQ